MAAQHVYDKQTIFCYMKYLTVQEIYWQFPQFKAPHIRNTYGKMTCGTGPDSHTNMQRGERTYQFAFC